MECMPDYNYEQAWRQIDANTQVDLNIIILFSNDMNNLLPLIAGQKKYLNDLNINLIC